VTEPGRERRLRRRTVYRGRIVSLHVDQVALPNGSRHLREVVGHRPAVAVVALLPGERVLLVRQHRYAVGRRLWELPAGIVDPGETPRQAAVRELREETGYRASRFRLLGAIYSSPGFSQERVHLYLAEGLRPAGPPTPDEDELLTARSLPLARALNLVRAGTAADGKTVLGLYWAACVRNGFHVARNPRPRYTNLDFRAAPRRRATPRLKERSR
jgi:ADP-ribose pyrophosphatase